MHLWAWFAVPLASWLQRWADFTLFCSIFSIMIPPVEIWNGFPQFQKLYVVFVNLVNHYGALNLRGSMVKSALKTYQYGPTGEQGGRPVDTDKGKGVE